MKSNYLSFCEYLIKIPPPDFSLRGGIKSPTTCHYQIFDENQIPVDKPCIYIHTNEQNDQVQLPVILRIFEENQNPVDMHTSI